MATSIAAESAGDYWRSAIAVEAMEMRWAVEGGVAVSGEERAAAVAGRGVEEWQWRVGVAVSE